MVLFLDKGYYLFMDNYYISVGLFEELHERKTLSCKVQQSSLPKDIFHLKARAVKELKRGVSLYRKKETFIETLVLLPPNLAQCMN